LQRSDLSIEGRVRQILAGPGLSLSEISRASRTHFPGDLRYFIPHNFYSDLHTATFSPSIFQVVALSALTQFSLVDWLAVFGFSLDQIPKLQAILPASKTLLIDPATYDRHAVLPELFEIGGGNPFGSLAPLSQWLTVSRPRSIQSLVDKETAPFLYAKIGSTDAFAFPDVLPGSIVRFDPRPLGSGPAQGDAVSKNLFLIEHNRGMTCSRIVATAKNKIMLCATELPYAHVELELGKEARIMGIADWELRPLANAPSPEVSGIFASTWSAESPETAPSTPKLSEFLLRARLRSGLSFREASAKSRQIAHHLQDKRYFCATGSLSDYETTDVPPRHIHKIISLCVLYSAKFWDFLTAAGLHRGKFGRNPMPPDPVAKSFSLSKESASATPYEFPKQLANEFEEIPLFLRGVSASHCGIPDLSLRDMFWLGPHHNSLHPYLSDAVLAIVNRRKKKPISSLSSPLWAQPLYILLRRDGSYLCTSCTQQGDTVVVRPFSDGFVRPVRFLDQVDVEVVGKVVAVVRRLNRLP